MRTPRVACSRSATGRPIQIEVYHYGWHSTTIGKRDARRLALELLRLAEEDADFLLDSVQ